MTAIIPIIAAAAPLLTPLIRDLVLNAQKLFGHNNGTGPTKAEGVINAALVIANQLSTAGKIPGVMTPESIAVLMEAIIQQLKASGVLPSDGPVATGTMTPVQTSGAQMVRFIGTMEVMK